MKKNKISINHSIGFTLLRGVFSIYIIVAIVVTLTHMTIEYFNVKQMIKNDLVLYQSTYEQPLSDALWDLDEDRINTIIDGVIKLPSITSVQIFDTNNNIITQRTSDVHLASNEIIAVDFLIDHYFDIEYRREDENSLVGVGVFYSDRDVILSKLSTGFTLIIINSIIKTLALWGIFLWLVRPMLIKPLEEFSHAVEKLNVDDLDDFKLKIDSPKRNELHVLADSFNQMAFRLNGSLQEIKASAFALNHANNYLEQLLLSAQEMMQVNDKEALFKQYVQFLHKGVDTLQSSQLTITYLNRITKSANEFTHVNYQLSAEVVKGHSLLHFIKCNEDTTDQLPVKYQALAAKAFMVNNEMSSELVVPLMSKNQVLGVITLGLLKETPLSLADHSYIETLTQLLVLIFTQLDNQQYLEFQVKKRTLELERSYKEIEQKASELERVSNYKSQFLANMSHEIRTPMNGIFGSLQILQNSVDNEESHEIILTGLSSCKSLLTILNDILDFSKIEAGKVEFEANSFDLKELLNNLYNEFKPIAVENSITLALNFDDHFHQYWLGDVTRVKQVLINIISNALKFTHQGSVNINISGSQEVVIKVIDTGIGMSEYALNSIFDRFEQADKSTTRKYGGTGLGVNIALNLAKMMGGNIEVQSKLGEGSCFVISLPLTRTNKQKILKEKALLATPQLKNITILLAEDTAINRTIFNKLMAPTSANILMAKNGAECIELFKTHHPKVIFMDIQMPVMDGVEACKIIRASSNIPIVAITANVMSEDVELYKEIGFDRVLSKPVQLQELYEACTKYIV
ncbi:MULTISPECIES: ATP-binding protein [unclassified Colwellia]|uniref:ATP-binding protein n=2 Tax=Colwellia TaxID=28228 RepID=UPI0015F47DFD|nr:MULTISPECIES: ATP-binding protein [unclassified Colwellia]MBA6355845.1 response regulator [Colwellia sp. BRX8-3]MBA6359498.1 response regulator [Colwellia sp. BRX8-6]MBA6366113.1 response regulator [Colwellia sp. BRX8-5]